MADYEELVELGFEGIDKIADKYHDRVYDHLPAWKRKQQKREAKGDQQQRQQRNPAPVAKAGQRSRGIGVGRPFEGNDDSERDMAYAQSQAQPYGREQGRDYRDDRDGRHTQNEGATSAYYRNAHPGAIVMRDNEAYAGRQEYGGTARWAPPNAPPPPAYGHGRDHSHGDQGNGGRPAAYRMRSTSWSPPRNQREEGEKPRRRRHSRSRSRSRDGARGTQERFAATLIGGLVGGLAGNRAGRGKKYDTAATVAGAVLGGIASRELAERIGSKKGEGRQDGGSGRRW